MTPDLDPQHQAVGDAVQSLSAHRHFTRSNPQRQQDYLHDLEDLAAEVLLCLREAGIAESQLIAAYQRLRPGPFTSVEAAIRTTCEDARDHLERTNP